MDPSQAPPHLESEKKRTKVKRTLSHHLQKHRTHEILVGSIIVIAAIVALLLARSANRKLGEQAALPTPTPRQSPIIKGSVVIKVKADVFNNPAQLKEFEDRLQTQYHATVQTTIPQLRTLKLQVPSGQEQTIRDQLKNDPAVENAQEEHKVHAAEIPNDPGFANQWAFHNTGQTIHLISNPNLTQSGTAGDDIHITDAWDITKGNSAVKIAIVDSGIDPTHADLASKVLASVNYSQDSGTADGNGHGTHDAGTAAAIIDNNTGVAGVCPNCSLLNARVLGNDNSGSETAIAQGITWAADQGAQVISLSIVDPDDVQVMHDAVDYAWSKGAVVLAAAGNCGWQYWQNNNCNSENQVMYPAGYNHVLAVAATDNNDHRAEFSEYGTWIGIAAPGAYIYSTWKGNSYNYESGTSMATPMVAGLAGLIWSTPYGTSNQAVIDRIEGTADPIPGTGTDWLHGKIDVAKAVGNQTPTTTPSPTGIPQTTATPAPTPTGLPQISPTSGASPIPTPTTTPTFVCLGSCDTPTPLPSQTRQPTTTANPTTTTTGMPPFPTLTDTSHQGVQQFRQAVKSWVQSLRSWILNLINIFLGRPVNNQTQQQITPIPTSPPTPTALPNTNNTTHTSNHNSTPNSNSNVSSYSQSSSNSNGGQGGF